MILVTSSSRGFAVRPHLLRLKGIVKRPLFVFFFDRFFQTTPATANLPLILRRRPRVVGFLSEVDLRHRTRGINTGHHHVLQNLYAPSCPSFNRFNIMTVSSFMTSLAFG
jgi:hypothetical protein